MTCGAIVLVQYPFTDDSGSKCRPVLIVSSDEYNRGEDRVVVPISSSSRADSDYSFAIREDAAEFRQTGLRTASFVKWTKPFTISRALFVRRLGLLPVTALSEVRARIAGMFA